MKNPDVRLRSTLRMTLFILVAAVTMVACAQEPDDLHIILEKKTQPVFSFDGRSSASDFEILELPRTKPLSKTNPFSFSGRTIWKISAPEGIKGANWPSVTYSEVPSGFSQTFPDHGSAPQLTADKLYAAQIVKDKDSKAALFFEIRNGKPVNVSDEVLGP